MKALAKQTSLVGADEKLVSSKHDSQLLEARTKVALTKAVKILNLEEMDLKIWLDTFEKAPKLAKLNLLHLIVRYHLDPICEEVSLVQLHPEHWRPFITIDGWIKLINQQATFTGIIFSESTQLVNGIPAWMECQIYRADRIHPITVREYFSEVVSELSVWKTKPRRMLRYRAMQQAARLAFGISGGLGQEISNQLHTQCNMHNLKNELLTGINIKRIDILKGLLDA